MNRIIIGIFIAIIGFTILITGFTISTDLMENRYYRITGGILVMAGIYLAPSFKRKKVEAPNQKID
ncbi:hypothetical protein [Fredinandcohnia quinoae]|uniref:DUF3098 domain-containing protein n=1 Tax=Fredinandcohnia quinoae TaxID=2918902 RepID=A0AAW5E4Q4_9BACI|nr:hypothetical protein [Fredinandcohnia sp. SECRCQ15]MCH1627915.1 hypothetical protein [Fredinandcohnia sp. SECRCQ15]